MNRVRSSTETEIRRWLYKLSLHPAAKRLDPDRMKLLAAILQRLTNVVDCGEGWSARCPAHADQRNSLTLNVHESGRFLVYCHACCDFSEIIDSLGVRPAQMCGSSRQDRSPLSPISQSRFAVKEPPQANPGWASRMAIYQSAGCQDQVKTLAERLQVSGSSLEAIGVAWCQDGSCWVFPEYNGHSQICGLVKRFPDGRKLAFTGSKRGLTLPAGWQEAQGPLFICEGATDVAAAISHGMRAIGRPAAYSGMSDLAWLLRGFPDEIKVVADNDPHAAGLKGADRLAKELAESLGKNIQVQIPLQEYKDLREMLTAFDRSKK